MIKPGALAIISPMVIGFLFRILGYFTSQPLLRAKVVTSMLMFATVAGILMALFLITAGGAWDNAKKYIETGALGGKERDCHKVMVGESKTSKASITNSNRALTSLQRHVGFQPQKLWLISQFQRLEPTLLISENLHVFQHPPPTRIEHPSSPTVATLDINTTAKKRGREPTTNPNAKKRKEGSKGEVKISKRLSRDVDGQELTEFITEMRVVLRQYAPLNVKKWAEVPIH